MADDTTSRAAARTAVRTRILAPDVARGLALLSIGWANLSTAWALSDTDAPGAYFGGVVDGSLLDQLFVVLSAMFAHVRGLPMFTVLLGFGVGLITMSLSRRMYPPKHARRALLRRYGFLALFGAVHLVLLFYGDIMLQYGALAMTVALMITLRDKTLLWIGGVLLGLSTLVGLAGAVATMVIDLGDMAGAGAGAWMPDFSGYAHYLGFNASMLAVVVFSLPATAMSLLPLVILGFVAARRGVHRNPRAYVRHLWAWVWVAVAIIVLVGLPWGLSSIGVLPAAWEPLFAGINAAVGYWTGPGIAAAVLLACQPLQEKIQAAQEKGEVFRPAWPLRVVAALGKRSMSAYILQSILFLILVLPFTLDLADGLGAAGYFLIAFGVWVVSLLGAWLLEAAAQPGPFERVHRRLSYGTSGLQDPWVPEEHRWAEQRQSS
ncbi:hypothetical protein B841_07575 [Corynebacterium maris DSM 45190]|uniref:DUF418 domain-containing protein n=1 Tax=Corynebacterium maris DSM 45190 TaxID=1224163 RepID=S5TJW4_9CORY|nr:DUF418 domain-containing protein [Corynebacterium maris]AGS34988.1 hypothetical protein B841_07575 [Corynebacterium maris DSM 45190]